MTPGWLRSLPDKSGASVLTQLLDLFTTFGPPQLLQSDNGTEFIAHKTKQFFTTAGIEHIPIQKGKPAQNGYIERFNRSYREGVLDAFVLSSLHQAREETTCWMEDYN